MRFMWSPSLSPLQPPVGRLPGMSVSSGSCCCGCCCCGLSVSDPSSAPARSISCLSSAASAAIQTTSGGTGSSGSCRLCAGSSSSPSSSSARWRGPGPTGGQRGRRADTAGRPSQPRCRVFSCHSSCRHSHTRSEDVPTHTAGRPSPGAASSAATPAADTVTHGQRMYPHTQPAVPAQVPRLQLPLQLPTQSHTVRGCTHTHSRPSQPRCRVFSCHSSCRHSHTRSEDVPTHTVVPAQVPRLQLPLQLPAQPHTVRGCTHTHSRPSPGAASSAATPAADTATHCQRMYPHIQPSQPRCRVFSCHSSCRYSHTRSEDVPTHTAVPAQVPRLQLPLQLPAQPHTVRGCTHTYSRPSPGAASSAATPAAGTATHGQRMYPHIQPSQPRCRVFSCHSSCRHSHTRSHADWPLVVHSPDGHLVYRMNHWISQCHRTPQFLTRLSVPVLRTFTNNQCNYRPTHGDENTLFATVAVGDSRESLCVRLTAPIGVGA